MQNSILNTATYSFKTTIHSIEDTCIIAENLGTILQGSNLRLLLLYGVLGSGKTTFSRAFVSSFKNACNAEVSSPTFTLVNHYPTSPAILHADIYRLAEMADCSIEEIKNASFPQLNLPEEIEEFLYDTTNTTDFALIEWADFLDSAELTKERLDIFLEISNNNRSLSLYVYTQEGKECLESLENKLSSIRNN